MRRAALIVLSWNQWPMTQRCLDSLLASQLDDAEIIVVDNGSSDGTPDALAAYADRCRIVALPENLGFVRGMNAGIAAAHVDDDVVLLNNDLVFTQADWLGRLRDAAYAQPENGIVGCRLLGPEVDGRVYHVGGFIEPDTLHGEQTESGTIERDVGQYVGTRRVQALAFALAYIRRDCIDRIGVLDTAFHSYFEDTDYCLRANAAGIACVLAGAVTLRHEQHGSTRDDGGFRARLFAASRATFAARWRQSLVDAYRGDALWLGVTRFPSAHADLARRFVRRLDARGLRMGFEPVVGELGDAQDRRLDIAAQRWQTAQPAASLVCAAGEHFARARGRWRVGYGFGEWTEVPRAWADATRALDLLLVPDAFQRDAFLAAGVTAPIDIVPPGVDRHYAHRDVPAPRQPSGAYVFLAIVEELARDAPELLLAAFHAAFDAGDDVELLIQIRPGRDALAIEQALAALASPRGARVRVIFGWGFPHHQRAQLLSAADAYVAVRRGAGWDACAADAVACGRVLIATAFGSQAELVKECGLGVDVARFVDDPEHRGRRWASPDHDALIAQLRFAFDHREALRAQAESRADAFAQAHDVDTSADRLVDALTRGATFAAARMQPRAHAPTDVQRAASGQIVVLGMHRSGTSSVAGVLARMGVDAGPEDDLLIGPDNPKGHYESGRLHGACLRRLEAAGGDWQHIPASAPAVAVDAFRRDVGALLDGFDARRPWLIKEPRLCLLARELLPLLTRPVFVHVVRDPRDVVASLVSRNGMSRTHAFTLWLRYTRAAFEASRGWNRVVVDYADLVADPVGVACDLRDALLAFGVQGLAEVDADAVRSWVEPARATTASERGELPAGSVQQLWASILDRSILDTTADAAGVETVRRDADAGNAVRHAGGGA